MAARWRWFAGAVLLAALTAAAVLLPGRFNPVDPQAEATVRAAAALLEAHSIGSEQLDWPKALSEALATVQGQARRSQVESAIHGLLVATGERHSYRLDADAFRKLTSEAVVEPGSLGRVQRLPGGIVAVSLQAYGVNNEAVWQQDAKAFRAELLQALKAGARGLRVDLTANHGGNMHPMLLALAPVLPEGPLGFFVGRSGEGTAFERPAREAGLAAVSLPIAVVTGPRTGSAGEFVLTALRAAKPVRTFGEATYGFTTCNVPPSSTPICHLRAGSISRVHTDQRLAIA
jgi:carboxyl-terminal processing protease